jgi:hypothetical protein
MGGVDLVEDGRGVAEIAVLRRQVDSRIRIEGARFTRRKFSRA